MFAHSYVQSSIYCNQGILSAADFRSIKEKKHPEIQSIMIQAYCRHKCIRFENNTIITNGNMMICTFITSILYLLYPCYIAEIGEEIPLHVFEI